MASRPIPGSIFKSPLFRDHSFQAVTVFSKKRYIWPHTFLPPHRLVSCGFYCLREADQAQCAFCHIIVQDWSPEIHPETIHLERSPLCPFLHGLMKNEETDKEKSLCELAVADLTLDDIASSSSCIEHYKFKRLLRIARNLSCKLRKKRAKLTCEICDSDKIDSVVLPCCHSFACFECVSSETDCFVCDIRIVGRIKIAK